MERGSLTIADAVASLSRRGGNADEIARNLIFLVAAGVLIPFARAYVPPESGSRRRSHATPALERAIAYAIDQGTACTVPSEVMGNGFPLDPGEARAVRDALAGGRSSDETRELLATLARLGLIV
jgi:hypothetical protein